MNEDQEQEVNARADLHNTIMDLIFDSGVDSVTVLGILELVKDDLKEVMNTPCPHCSGKDEDPEINLLD